MTVLQEHIHVPRPAHEVFAYVADFTTTPEWDSTARAAEKLTPGPIAVGTRFAVSCATPVGAIDLAYEITSLEPDSGITLKGSSRFFSIEDRITFTPSDAGTRIDYRAEFRFPPVLQRLSKTFEGGLQRMGRQSMAGLKEALEDDYPPPEASLTSRIADRLVLPGLARFTRLGYSRGRRKWHPMSAYLADKHIAITGASAGLGYAAAMELARRGASLTLIMRDPAKAERVVEAITMETGNRRLRVELADLSLMSEVDNLVDRLTSRGDAIDVLVNNAGALFNPRGETSEGIEQSLALLLLSPHRLTEGLKSLLDKAEQPRVVNVVSGGMYSQKLDLPALLGEKKERYSGSVAYARAKRALMIVTEHWAQTWARDGVVVNAMHPGWADTPGVQSALPEFRSLTRHILRTPEQGADTIVWLAAATEAGKVSGRLFLDRQPHTTHLLRSTRESGEEREALLHYLADVRAGRHHDNTGAHKIVAAGL
jgi:NAD(P)-dependent dehydrogenase (short-subunit alcohol dehydrogenase family)